MSDFNGQIIEEFRANAGHVTTAGFGDNLILVHTVGVKSGQPRINPLLALPDGDSWLVIGSAGGSPKAPAWVHNIRALPQVTIEVPADGGITEMKASVRELSPAEWDDGWQRFLDKSDGFRKYTETSEGRQFPIFRLTPVGG
ncbi:nitroreductase family deazaflavin-dependent oxidoreductase [Gordonia insulae]|uniref:nitroreductase family deazaflavin-dependent oxidoreductase n=1 Tax=Gordonia insulae TaxID=2420509 RepID=UPI000F5BE7C3|nr:nitroreductase family deazaflavin-dependent oxidoreductase [Gordonia insulae]